MSKKSKEEIENLENKEIKSTDKKSTSTAKKTTSKKVTTSTKKISTKVTTSEKKENAKATTASNKKTTSKKTATKKSTTKAKTATAKKATAKSKKSTTKSSKKVWPAEYYDLPQKYNKTVVKVLAQTPKTLFIYWEISDDDIEKFKKDYGDNFFETTKPVLIIHNDTLNYSFEVEINDFANSWYLHVNDAKSDYRIEIGRRPIHSISNIKEDYIYITSSNEIESPNDRILFDKSQKMVYFKNTKTNKKIGKDLSISFIKNMGKVYNIYDLYKEFYNKENIDELYNLSNPSSSNPSSKF